VNKHVAYLLAVVLLTAFGIFVCVVDVLRHGQLHLTNAVVGGGSLMVATALAIPMQMKEAVSILTPFLDRLRAPSK
jgi:hypothetical protein